MKTSDVFAVAIVAAVVVGSFGMAMNKVSEQLKEAPEVLADIKPDTRPCGDCDGADALCPSCNPECKGTAKCCATAKTVISKPLDDSDFERPSHYSYRQAYNDYQNGGRALILVPKGCDPIIVEAPEGIDVPTLYPAIKLKSATPDCPTGNCPLPQKR